MAAKLDCTMQGFGSKLPREDLIVALRNEFGFERFERAADQIRGSNNWQFMNWRDASYDPQSYFSTKV